MPQGIARGGRALPGQQNLPWCSLRVPAAMRSQREHDRGTRTEAPQGRLKQYPAQLRDCGLYGYKAPRGSHARARPLTHSAPFTSSLLTKFTKSSLSWVQKGKNSGNSLHL